MNNDVKREIIDLATLDEVARERLTEEMFALNTLLFDGVDHEQFVREVIALPARWTRIQLLRNAAGELIGYNAAHLFDRVLEGRPCSIFRVEAGILRAYRGRRSTFLFGMRQALAYRLRHPFRRLYLFCTPVHPSSYCLLAGHFHEVYPGPGRPVPPAMQTLMQEMADGFGEIPAASGDPGLRQVGWITREGEQETLRWQASEAPEVRFYLTRNPDYRQGVGLVTLVPLSWRNLLMTSWKASG
ncbi:hypothetical protein BOX17_05145 [Halomonas aestuarii]|uniref:N-acetyltransferase domain-containing protein n=1 Tax=Halomonas aestuarii TaxID=1897729 RepID=A0A1J0VEE2_9GAMM|nr:hypothetical protein [Halomonas aestuarii]APE30396.1 hypothetical protein BOX17_05145 [Halomonas aestuarii]